MSKFKVGDLVLVKKPVDTHKGPAWVGSMDHLDATIVEVEGPFSEHGGMMCFSSGEWIIADDWAEIVSPADDPSTLTRRDHFAMAALTGLCANCDSTGMFAWTPEGVTDFASRIADLMEAARNKEGAE